MGRAEDIFQRIKDRGELAIDDFILCRQSEELYLDFKRSSDDGRGPKVLSTNDRNNLAKAISGFGNSEGGVIVWGIDASRDIDYADVAKAKFPIQNLKRFVSWLEGAVSGCTIPAHNKVENHSIDSGSGNGYVATLIRKSELTPNQCTFDMRYYMRAGSSFHPVSHAVLAGMFGRRPQPWVYNTYTTYPVQVGEVKPGLEAVTLRLGFQLFNEGPTIATGVFTVLKVLPPRENCTANWQQTSDNLVARNAFGFWLILVSKDAFRLPPASPLEAVVLHMVLSPPFTRDLWIERTLGCDGAPPTRIVLENSKSEVGRLYAEFLAGSRSKKAGFQLVSDLFKIPIPSLEKMED